MVRALILAASCLALTACTTTTAPKSHRAQLLETYGRPEHVSTQPDGTQVVTWRRRYGMEVEVRKYTIDRAGNVLKVWNWGDPS